MDNLPVAVDYENQTNWREDSKKLLKEEFRLHPVDIEGIERILGTSIDNSVDEVRETVLSEDKEAEVFRPQGIINSGKEPVVLAYDSRPGLGDLASLITYSKIMKINQELEYAEPATREGAFPQDDNYSKKVYTQFVTALPKEYIDGLEVSTRERSELDVARKNYLSKLSDAVDRGASEAPGNKNLHMQLQRAKKEIQDPVFIERFEHAVEEYQEKRETVLPKIAARAYHEKQQNNLDIAKLIHPTREAYNASKKFLNSAEKRTHDINTENENY